MGNSLNNGTILPYGLLGKDYSDMMRGFNHTYRNDSLKIGVVVASYDATDPNNRTKLTTEYDVACIEQFENKGVTALVYRNCIATTGLGSVADFFEKNLRVREQRTDQGQSPRLNNQNGTVVMLLCLNKSSDNAIIISGFPHPNRPTTIPNTDPALQGEYNGVNVQVATDGSCKLTFKGATDNNGNPTDPDQAGTVLSIETDGTVQIQQPTVTLRLDRSGDVTLTASGEVRISAEANLHLEAHQNVEVVADGNVNVSGQLINLGADVTDKVILGDTFKKLVFDVHQHPTPVGISGPPVEPMLQQSLSNIVKAQ